MTVSFHQPHSCGGISWYRSVGTGIMTDSFSKAAYARVAGPEGLQLYEQWKARRGPRAEPLICRQSTTASATPSQGQPRISEESEDRRRLACFLRLDKQYPEAKVPIGILESLEFCQRCFWLGCSLPQGASLRAHNRKRGLVWP